MPNELKPCPFCGGKAIPREAETTPEHLRGRSTNSPRGSCKRYT